MLTQNSKGRNELMNYMKQHLLTIQEYHTVPHFLPCFLGGKVPLDGARKERKVLNCSLLQLIFVSVFAVIGLIYSLGFLYFNISKRNHKLVRTNRHTGYKHIFCLFYNH